MRILFQGFDKKWTGYFALSLLLTLLSFEALAFVKFPKEGTCPKNKPCGTYPGCLEKQTCPDYKKVCDKRECDPSIGDKSFWFTPPSGMLGFYFPLWWGPCINNIQKQYRCQKPFDVHSKKLNASIVWEHCTDKDAHNWNGKTRPCGTCTEDKPCGTYPDCAAKVDCPGGGEACTLAECPGKTSYPGFNIGNLILGNLPKTAHQSLPPNTRVPLNQAGAVVHGALRVYVESFDDFKVCDKQGQCYKVCYSDGTNCPPQKKK